MIHKSYLIQKIPKRILIKINEITFHETNISKYKYVLITINKYDPIDYRQLNDRKWIQFLVS